MNLSAALSKLSHRKELNTMESIGRILWESRQKAHLSAEESAARAEVDTKTVYRYEHDESRPSLANILRLAQVYGDAGLPMRCLPLMDTWPEGVPQVPPQTISVAAINMLHNVRKIEAAENIALSILADGRIDPQEQNEWGTYMDSIEDLYATCWQLLEAALSRREG